MSKYQDYLARKKREYGAQFSASELSAQFVPYYNTGARIEVDFGEGEVKRGTIGITSGWRPCFLLMLTRRSIGSVYTLSNAHKIVKVVHT